MTGFNEYELRESKERIRQENIKLLERIYKKGAGCFGVGKRAPEIKKELDKLRNEN